MKKLILLASVAGMFAITSCGPSAEEKAKMEAATQDSIKAAEDAMRAAEEAAAAAAVVPVDTAAVLVDTTIIAK